MYKNIMTMLTGGHSEYSCNWMLEKYNFYSFSLPVSLSTLWIHSVSQISFPRNVTTKLNTIKWEMFCYRNFVDRASIRICIQISSSWLDIRQSLINIFSSIYNDDPQPLWTEYFSRELYTSHEFRKENFHLY